MGLLDRFRTQEQEYTYGIITLGDYRQEATTRTPSTGVDRRNYPTNYVSDMITGQVWNRENIPDLGKVARFDPQGWTITYGMASAIIDPWFSFIDADGNEVMKDVLDELIRLEAKKWLTLAVAFERAYGYSWLRVVDSGTDYRVDTVGYDPPENGFMLDVFNPENTEVDVYDKYGRPTKLRITVPDNTAENGKQVIPIDASEFILIRTRPYDRSHKGLPATAPSWDYMTYLRLTFNAIANYAQKVGLGAFVIKTKAPMSSELKAAMVAMAKDLSTNRYAMIDGRFIESLEFVGATASAINFGEYISAMMEQIAAGSGLPKDIIIGASAGAISGGEINSKEAAGYIMKEQTKLAPYIRELVRRLGYDVADYRVEWNTKYATDEKEEAEIEVAHVSANVARLQYCTKNEVRDIDNMPPIEGGDETPGSKPDIQFGWEGESPEKQEQTRNPEGDQLG